MISQICLVLACAFSVQCSVYLNGDCSGSAIDLSNVDANCYTGDNILPNIGLPCGDLSSNWGVASNIYPTSDVASSYINGQDTVLPTLGPRSSCLAPLNLPTVVVPAPSRTVDLPAPAAPAPRVISNTCSCSKLVRKPQIVQRLVRRPSTIRVIRKNWVPVTKSISYSARGLTGPEPCRPSAQWDSAPLSASCGSSISLSNQCGC